jgi:hypothetical protein
MVEHAAFEGVIEAGETVGDFRATFADDIAAEIVFPGDDQDALREFIADLAWSVAAFLRFGYEAVRLYISEQPEDRYTVVNE